MSASLLDKIEKLAGDASKPIPATVFQKAVDASGLKFGSRKMDEIMLKCNVTSDGHVDVSSLASTRAEGSRQNHGQQPSTPGRKETAPPKAAFLRSHSISTPKKTPESFDVLLSKTPDKIQGKDAPGHEDFFDIARKVAAHRITPAKFRQQLGDMGMDHTSPKMDRVINAIEAGAEVPFSDIARGISESMSTSNKEIKASPAKSPVVRKVSSYGIGGYEKTAVPAVAERKKDQDSTPKTLRTRKESYGNFLAWNHSMTEKECRDVLARKPCRGMQHSGPPNNKDILTWSSTPNWSYEHRNRARPGARMVGSAATRSVLTWSGDKPSERPPILTHRAQVGSAVTSSQILGRPIAPFGTE